MRCSLAKWMLTRFVWLSSLLALSAAGPGFAQVALRLDDTETESQTILAAYEAPAASCQTCWQDRCIPDEPVFASRAWGRAEYLWWQTKGNELPPLVSGAPNGILPGAPVLYGGEEIDDGFRSGLRVSGGLWLDDCQETGIEANYFGVFDDGGSGDYFAQTTGGTGSGDPVIARPFNNLITALPDALLVSFPGVVDGSIEVSSQSEMHSASVLVRRCFKQGTRGRMDLIGGYRYFRFREGLLISQSSISTAVLPPPPLGTTFDIYDRFTAENDFHGGEIGLVTELGTGNLSVELLAKVALGNLHRLVAIDGGTLIQTPVPPSSGGVGGLLALQTNIGQYTDNDFAALPEFGINAKYQLTQRLSVLGGATLLMLNDVVRTGEQMDTFVNPTYFPNAVPVGEPRPMTLTDNVTDFWAAGLSAGIQIEM